MARLGVTYQDIDDAANHIQGQGRQPTIELIRNHLGTGSTTTIANHLRKWRAEHDGSTSVAIKENLPPEFISVMKSLWQRLQTHADSQIAIVKQAAEQALHHQRQEGEKYKTNNQRWQKMHEAWVKEKEALLSEKLDAEQAIARLQTENVALTATSVAEQQRIHELHRLHQLAQENLEHYRESARVQRLNDQEKHAQQFQQMALSLQHTEQQLAIANQDNHKLQQQLDIGMNENSALKHFNEGINHQLDKMQSELKGLEKLQDHLVRDAAQWQQQYELLQKKFDNQNTTLFEKEKQNALLVQQIFTLQHEVEELKVHNKSLINEKLEIMQDKAQLEGIN